MTGTDTGSDPPSEPEPGSGSESGSGAGDEAEGEAEAGSGSGSGVPWRSPVMYVVISGSFLAVSGVPLISPVLPLMSEQLSLTDFEAGLMITSFTFAGFLFAPVVGVLSDRIGRRGLFIGCFALYGIAGSAIVVIPEYTTILLVRFLQGIAGGGLVTISLTLIGDYYRGRERTAVMGMNAAALSAGGSLSPFFGGLLAGVSWRTPFLLFAGSVALGVAAFFLIEEPMTSDDAGAGGLSYLRSALETIPRGRALLLYSGVFSAFVFLFGGVHTAVPFLLNSRFGVSVQQIGLVISVPLSVSILISTQNGRLNRYLSNTGILFVGFLGYALALLGSGLAPAPAVVALGILFFGVGMGTAPPALDTAIAGLVPDSYRGGVMSLRTSIKRLGQTVGPVLFTALVPFASYPVILLVAGGLALLIGSALFVVLRPDP